MELMEYHTTLCGIIGYKLYIIAGNHLKRIGENTGNRFEFL